MRILAARLALLLLLSGAPADAFAQADGSTPTVAAPAPLMPGVSPPSSVTAAVSPAAPAIPASPTAPSDRTPAEVVKIILGLVAILALAYLAGDPRVIELENALGISQAVTSGLPFVLMGLFAHHPEVDLLSDRVLAELQPLLPLGLGWIGLSLGFRFDARVIETLPKSLARGLLLTTGVPFLFVVAAAALLLALSTGFSADIEFLRDAILLGSAGAVTARTLPSFLRSRGVAQEDADRVARLVQLEELAAMTGLLVVAAFFRPAGEAGWKLPGIAWIFVTLGMATAISGMIYAILAGVRGIAEIMVVLLGSVALLSGMASFLRLSPVVVCFLSGALLRNLPGTWKTHVRDALDRLERPVYLIFLVIAGALWRVADWQGWALLVLFVVARSGGKRLAVVLHQRRHPGDFAELDRWSLSVSPLGALAVAIVVNAQTLYSSPTLPWIVTAVIGGAMVTEVFVQIAWRARKASG